MRTWEVPAEVPLLGAVSFGLIDRGTNVIQVRPSTACPLSCIFCSTDAGPCSRYRATEYLVGLDHMLEWFRGLAKVKGGAIEAHIDTVGDPLVYPHLADLIQGIRGVGGVGTVSLQTHGHLLTEKLLDDLSEAGLSRINLSIDALDPGLARRLSGTESYDVERVVSMAGYITENTDIDLLLAPVWVHPLNDSEIEGLISLALKIGAGKRAPPLGIQKCDRHRYGRRAKGARYITWYQFYRQMRDLEGRLGVKLILKPSDFGIRPARAIGVPVRRGEKVRARTVGPGWLRGESLAVLESGDRTVTVVGAELPEGKDVKVRILRVRDGILVGSLAG